MALSLGFGILFATLITLVIVPALYLMIDDLHRLSEKAKRIGLPDNAPGVNEHA